MAKEGRSEALKTWVTVVWYISKYMIQFYASNGHWSKRAVRPIFSIELIIALAIRNLANLIYMHHGEFASAWTNVFAVWQLVSY